VLAPLLKRAVLEKVLPDVLYLSNPYEVADGADALILMTEAVRPIFKLALENNVYGKMVFVRFVSEVRQCL